MKILLKTTLLLLITTAILGCSFKKNLEPKLGEYEGVGLEVYGGISGILVVISVVKESPADIAGITVGDFILKINDEEAKSLLFEQAINKISGAAGSKVELLIERNNQIYKFSIVRAVYQAREDNLIRLR